jgi:hypothetical protein
MSNKERPILFSGEMVRAILDGRKTQTRRVVNRYRWHYKDGSTSLLRTIYHGSPISDWEMAAMLPSCPYGQVGDRLWVRETWNVYSGGYDDYAGGWEVGYPYGTIPKEKPFDATMFYAADGEDGPWRPAIHMPRWASRITLEITDIRVERLQDISEEDAIREGVKGCCFDSMTGAACYDYPTVTARERFQKLWDGINGKRGHSWESNPWVWVISFEVEGATNNGTR